MGKPYHVCGARVQAEICKTKAPFKHLFVTHLIIDVLNCKDIFLSKLLICLPHKPQVKDAQSALCKSLHLAQSCRTGCFHRRSSFPSHLSMAGEESSVLRHRGSCLITWQGFAQPYSQSTQVFRLSSFVLNSVFRTSPKLQSSCNLKGQIDLVLHHSCTQAVVSHKQRRSDAVHPARWELG